MASVYNEQFKFVWLLPNIFLCQQNLTVSSPEFTVDILNNAAFFLTLEYMKKASMAAITLKRVFKRDLPENFHPITVRASIFDPHSAATMGGSWKEVYHEEHLACMIQAFFVPEEFINGAEESEMGIMVKYEFRLNPIDHQKYFKYLSSKSRNLRILSKDFSRMLVEGQYYDVVFKVHDIKFKAHRFILQARAPKFYAMLKDDNQKGKPLVRKVKNIQSSQFGIILNFIYSGLLQEASDLSLWSIIDFLHRNEVIVFEDGRCMLSNGCIAKSSIYDEKIYLIWNLDLKVLNLRLMPSFRLLPTKHLNGETFLLSIWETTDLYDDVYLKSSLKLSHLRKGSTLHARIVIGILDENLILSDWTETVHSFTSDSDICFPAIISRDELIERNLNRNLKVLYKIFLCQETKEVKGHSNKLSNKFLQDMRRLLDMKLWWDLKLVYSNDMLLCHKPILMARSSVLKNALMDERNHFINRIVKELYFDDTNASALTSFLNYLYTGEVEVYKYRNYLKLYNLANIYDVHELKEICREYLISEVNLKNALELFETSQKYSDDKMKTLISKFIFSHYKKFVHSQAFVKGVKEKPDLIIEIARSCIPKPHSGYVTIK